MSALVGMPGPTAAPVRRIERDCDARTMDFRAKFDRIGKPVSFGDAENMSSKTAHATEFRLVNRPIPRPVDVIRCSQRAACH